MRVGALLLSVILMLSLLPTMAFAEDAETCQVAVTLSRMSASFRVPVGRELKITWKFIHDENDVPKGWLMVVNGTPLEKQGYSYVLPENIDGITLGAIGTSLAVFSYGKPDSLTVTANETGAGASLSRTLDYTELTDEEREFELRFVERASGTLIGIYKGLDGSGYHTSTTYGISTIKAVDRQISNYDTRNLKGYRLCITDEAGEYDSQKRTLTVGQDGVTPKSVTMYVEVNHSTISDLHTQPVEFQEDGYTVLKTDVRLKNAFVNKYTPIELDFTAAMDELSEMGYRLVDDGPYTVACDNYKHDPAVTRIAVVSDCEHTWSDWVQTKAPNCSELGEEARTCGKCNARQSRELPIDPDAHIPGEPVRENETSESYEEVVYCVKCKAELRRETKTVSDTDPFDFSILALLVAGASSPYFSFKDVPASVWYYDAVKSAWKTNLINGVTETEFRPEENMTVAQAIKLAAAVHQLNRYGKVSLQNGRPSWYSTYVQYAVDNGLIESAYADYTDAQMNAAVTRAEFVHIFHAATDDLREMNTVADNAIPDVKTGDAFAAEIYNFYRAGVLTGSDANGTFHPADSIKRSEVAAILIRMYDSSTRVLCTF